MCFWRHFFNINLTKVVFSFLGSTVASRTKLENQICKEKKSELNHTAVILSAATGMQPLEQDVQRGCVVSILGDFQDQVGQSPQQLPMKSKLTHLWAGVWSGVLPRRALKSKWLHIYAMRIKHQYMSLKTFIHSCLHFSSLVLFILASFSSSNICTHKGISPFASFPVSEGWSGLQTPELHPKYFPTFHQLISYNILHFVLLSFLQNNLPFCCPVVVWLPLKISKLKLWPVEQNIFTNIKYHTEECVANGLFQFNAELKGKLHLLIEDKPCCCFLKVNM